MASISRRNSALIPTSARARAAPDDLDASML
jgi:hypothetical protein